MAQRPGNPRMQQRCPVGDTQAASGTKWSGTCKFTKEGTYTFWCTVHHSEMTGTITVAANGTTTMTMSMGSTESSTSAPTTSTSTTSPGSGSQTQPTSGPAGPSPLASLLVGSESSAVRLAATQHGQSVHGSVAVSQAGAGGKLEVELLAGRASLASAPHQPQVQVGRVVRSSLPAGTVTYTVALDARARHALRVRGRLTLTVRIRLSSAHGSAVTITRSVRVRA